MKYLTIINLAILFSFSAHAIEYVDIPNIKEGTYIGLDRFAKKCTAEIIVNNNPADHSMIISLKSGLIDRIEKEVSVRGADDQSYLSFDPFTARTAADFLGQLSLQQDVTTEGQFTIHTYVPNRVGAVMPSTCWFKYIGRN